MTLPVLDATICFLRKNGKTLFIDYRKYDHPLHRGKYSAPGGKIDSFDKSIEESVVRELLEETGIQVKNTVYRGKVFFNNEERHFRGKPAKWSFRVYYFDSFNFDDSNAKSNEGRLEWVSNEEVLDLPMHDGDKVIWKWLEEYKEINAEVIHKGDKLANSRLLSFKA